MVRMGVLSMHRLALAGSGPPPSSYLQLLIRELTLMISINIEITTDDELA